MTDCSHDELVVCSIARLLRSAGIIAVGSSSPVPAAAALLAQAYYKDGTQALIFRNTKKDPFPESGSELYERVGQGRIDVFFLSGGQIDGEANLNMVGVGKYPEHKVRFPGSHGTPYIYFMVPRVILYREEHSKRVLVPRVDFISAKGVTPPEVFRRGGPSDLITGKAHFAFNPGKGRFSLVSVHPGHTAAEVEENTGFDYDSPQEVPATQSPAPDMLQLLRSSVAREVAETYPLFAKDVLGYAPPN